MKQIFILFCLIYPTWLLQGTFCEENCYKHCDAQYKKYTEKYDKCYDACTRNCNGVKNNKNNLTKPKK